MPVSRLWIISELYYPEVTSTGYFLTAIAEGLAQEYSVAVLCGQPTYSMRGQRAAARERRREVEIHRCLSTTFNKDVLVGRLVNAFSITIAILWHALWKVRSGDCVLVVTNPPVLPFGIRLVCAFCGVRCVLLVHDVYPDILVASGLMRRESFATRILCWLTKKLYHSVDAIIVIGRDMRELVSRRMHDAHVPIYLIPHWGDVGAIYPRARGQNELLRELGLIDKFVVQYSGNMGRSHGLEVLVEVARILRDTPQVHFLLIGSGVKKQWLHKTATREGLDNITFLPERKHGDLPDSLNACDLAVISLIEGMCGVSVPSRMYNVLAAGKPILAISERDSELALVVSEENLGWVVSPGDVAGILDALRQAQSDPARLREMGRRARSVAERKYSYDEAITSYRRAVHTIMGTRG